MIPKRNLVNLIKICEVICLPKPKDDEICKICQELLPNLNEETLN